MPDLKSRFDLLRSELIYMKAEYDRFDEEFAFLDEFLKAQAVAGITQ